jgi:hypothetical protein
MDIKNDTIRKNVKLHYVIRIDINVITLYDVIGNYRSIPETKKYINILCFLGEDIIWFC